MRGGFFQHKNDVPQMKLRENVGFGENDEVAHSVLWLLVENLVV